MKCFIFYFLSVIFLINVLNAHPSTKKYGKKYFQQSEKLTDDVSLEEGTEQKMLSCAVGKFELQMSMCETETEKEPTDEELKKITATQEAIELYVFQKYKQYCECFMKKSDMVDGVTGQLDVAKFVSQTLEETTLSPEQKSTISTEIKSCLGFSEPILYIDGFGTKPTDAKSGNSISPVETTLCLAISLIKNGCPNDSVSSSDVATVLKRYSGMKDLSKAKSSS